MRVVVDPGSSVGRDGETSPERTYALVVGVERYDVGPDWDLDGPASDAARVTAWLLGRGVPADQVLVFLSRLDDRPLDPPLPPEVTVRQARREAVNEALTRSLPERRGGLLWLFWGGHGVLTRDESRRLFYADATKDDKRNLDLNSLLIALRSDLYARFPRQVVIVDTCQTHAERHQFANTLPTETFAYAQPSPTRHQFVLYAASPGQVAANRGGAGVFSEALLKELVGAPPTVWPPDMDVIAARLDKRFVDLREAERVDQVPAWFQYRTWLGKELVNVAASWAADGVTDPQPGEADMPASVAGINPVRRFGCSSTAQPFEAVAVSSIVFGPIERQLATGSDDGTAQVWDSKTGRMLAEFPHNGPITSVAFSPDGGQLATGSNDGTARIWDSATGRQVTKFPHDRPVTSVAFSPDGSQLATGSDDGSARIWDTGFTVVVVPIPSDDWRDKLKGFRRNLSDYEAITGVHMSVDDVPDAIMLSCLDPTRLEIGRRTLERLISEGRFYPEWIEAVHKSASREVGNEVRQAGEDGQLDFSDSGRELARFTHDGPVTSVAFSPDGHQLATGSDDIARIWSGVIYEDVPLLSDDLKSSIMGVERNNRAFKAITGVNLVNNVPQGAMVLQSSFDLVRREIARRVLQNLISPGRIDPAVIVETWGRVKVEFENDRQAIEDGRFRMGDHRREPVELAHDCLVTSLAFHPNGYQLATGSHDGARIWPTSRTIYGPSLTLRSKTQIDTVAFNREGSWLATAGQGPSASVWKVSNGELLKVLIHDDHATAVAFSPFNYWLAAGTRNKQAVLWDLMDVRTKELLEFVRS